MQLFLFFVCACNVVKGRLAVLVVCILDFGFAKAHFLAAKARAAHSLHQENPKRDAACGDNKGGNKLKQQRIVACANIVVLYCRACLVCGSLIRLDIVQKSLDIRELTLNNNLLGGLGSSRDFVAQRGRCRLSSRLGGRLGR